ncbi:LysE family translocator [Halosimplex amylolyticum]|uniref:LysE family translocator n=1 Tax=Halosimplex amylolyticum TaxID=3396616 RepID=UPI003F56DC3E
MFGLALAAPPGPMNAVIAEESVLRGWIAGFTAGLGAMSADLIFFALSLAGVVAFLDGAPTVRAVMVGVGGLLMLYFATGAVRDARADFLSDDAGPSPDDADARGFTKAFVLALTNPYQILFWLTVGVGLLEPGTVDVLSYLPAVGDGLAGVLVVRTGSPALLAGLFGGIVVWIVGFPATLVSVGRRVDAFAPAAAAASALVLAGFGVTFCWTAARTLLDAAA